MRALTLVVAIALAAQPVSAQPDSETAPPPFTAEELSRSFEVGEEYVYRVTTPESVQTQIMRFVAVSQETATIESELLDEAGAPVSAPAQSEATWAELESHGRYPAVGTQIEEVTIDVPAGSYAGVRYTMTEQSGIVTVAEFARDLPGPPIRYTQTLNDQPTYRMELLAHNDPPAGPPAE